MGQSSKNFPLQEAGLAFPTITETGEKEYTGSAAGRIQQLFSAAFPAHHTGTNEELW